jgi:hypothetical protein
MKKNYPKDLNTPKRMLSSAAPPASRLAFGATKKARPIRGTVSRYLLTRYSNYGLPFFSLKMSAVCFMQAKDILKRSYMNLKSSVILSNTNY